MNRRELLKICLVATGCVLISTGAYFALKQKPQNPLSPPEKTPIWKTYQDSEAGIAFEYPTNLNVRNQNLDEYAGESGFESAGQFLENFSEITRRTPPPTPIKRIVLESETGLKKGVDGEIKSLIDIWVFSNPDGLELDIWRENYDYFPIIFGTKDIKIQPENQITIDGITTEYYLYDGFGIYDKPIAKIFLISKNDRIFLFAALTEYDEITKEVFSTVNFLKKGQ